jgi:hypothetical protein
VSALSHFLESEGVATTGISLVRPHTEQMQPPRALWVPFILGRPFGSPDDSVFQRRVLEAALSLFDAGPRPVLADFPDDAPGAAPVSEAWTCPVSFPPPPVDPDDLGAAVAAEIGQLAPWYAESQRNVGRTSVSGQNFTVEEAAAHAALFLGDPPETGPAAVVRLKQALEDLKAFYSEAAAARPGASSEDMADWLWQETALGRLMFKLADTLKASPDEYLNYMAARSMVPRAQAEKARATAS